jgi:hypothetical protein
MNLIERYIKEYSGAYNGEVDPTVADDILGQIGIENEVYRDWLIMTGGGPIGPDWYDGVDELIESKEKRESEDWTISGNVIGWDGSGNPIALQTDGRILVEDHNFGGIHLVALTFTDLLTKHTANQAG